MTECNNCGTDWSDCDVLAGGVCAACLEKENERLRAVEEAHLASSAEDAEQIAKLEAEIERLRTERDAALEAARRLLKVVQMFEMQEVSDE
jgi:reverse gyrase